MGTPDISQELSTSPRLNYPNAGGPVVAAIVADALDFTTYAGLITTGSQTTTLTRKPAGSAAAIASHAFTADLAGEYDVTVATCGVSRGYRVVAFPAACPKR